MCINFLNTILVENGDKKKQMQKNMGNLLKMSSFPQYSSTPSSCNTKLVQLTFFKYYNTLTGDLENTEQTHM